MPKQRPHSEEIAEHIATIRAAKAKTIRYALGSALMLAWLAAAVTVAIGGWLPTLTVASYLLFVACWVGPHLRWCDERCAEWETDLQRWREYEAEEAADIAAARESLEEAKGLGTKPWAQVKAELGL